MNDLREDLDRALRALPVSPAPVERARRDGRRLRNRRRATYLAEQQDLYLKLPAIVLHLQQIADPNISRCLGNLLVQLNPAKLASPCRQRPRLEKSGSPKPLIHPHRSHESIFV